jgi:hypothetical protein
MSTCSECSCYDPVDAETGKCKYHEAERIVKPIDGCIPDVENGWPIVNGSEEACRNFE